MAFTVDQTAGGGVQQLLNTLPKDVFQKVVPWLCNRRHLSEILNLTPGGLSSLLIPQRTVERGSGGSGSGGNGLDRLHLSSQAACRQALLKSVSDRINLMLLVERPNLLASNGSIVYESRMKEGAGTFRQPVFGLVQEVRRGLCLDWTGLQRTTKTFLRGFLNDDGPRDFYSFPEEVLHFFGNNGLTHTLDVSVHLMLAPTFCWTKSSFPSKTIWTKSTTGTVRRGGRPDWSCGSPKAPSTGETAASSPPPSPASCTTR
jgi:hypothetical protein